MAGQLHIMTASGAQLSPPSLAQCCPSKSSLRAVAGDVTEAVWGASSLGGLLKAKRPDMEVIPSPQLRCGEKWARVCGTHGYACYERLAG